MGTDAYPYKMYAWVVRAMGVRISDTIPDCAQVRYRIVTSGGDDNTMRATIDVEWVATWAELDFVI